MNKDIRVVITGIGVVSAVGSGKDEFWSNLVSGTSGIKQISLFDVSNFKCKHAAKITNFHPEEYLEPIRKVGSPNLFGAFFLNKLRHPLIFRIGS